MSQCPHCKQSPCVHTVIPEIFEKPSVEKTMPSEADLTDIGRTIANDVYRVVYEKIYMHESRGFNAHARAQEICEQAKFEAVKWLKLQYGLGD